MGCIDVQDETISAFFGDTAGFEAIPFGNGHINHTFKVRLIEKNADYIIQKINKDVFKNPIAIAENHLRLEKLFAVGSHQISIARLIPTQSGDKLHEDKMGNYWRLTSFIPDTYALDIVAEPWQAGEAGNAFGWFLKVCDYLSSHDFIEAIPDFHSLNYRAKQFDESIKNNIAGRLDAVLDMISFYKEVQEKLQIIENLKSTGELPQRIVHNDTKINNLLFRDNKAVAIIDLDTVGPGIMFYDYGDAIRTTANTAAEDEQDPDKVDFNIETFEAFTQGFIDQIKSIATIREKELLYLAPPFMTFIMGIRFLTDYLNGDAYYKISFENHNLARSRVQRKLIECMNNKGQQMQDIIRKNFNS